MQQYKDILKKNPAYRLISPKAQSYLFCGGDPLGLLYLALFFIEEQCGKTASADIIHLPFGDKVLVSDIDFLTEFAQLTPVELPCKYYIINNGDTMTDAAANKLLKTLEEPPPCVRIIVLCRDERSVLPTIRSRCHVVALAPFSDKELCAFVDTHYFASPNAYLAKELSLGSITRLEKAVSGQYNGLLDIVFDTLLFMKSSQRIAMFAQKILARKAELNDIIDLFEIALNDCALLSAGMPVTLSHKRADLGRIAEFYNADTIVRLGGVFMRARRRLLLSGNATSVIDEFLFSLLEVRQKCQK